MNTRIRKSLSALGASLLVLGVAACSHGGGMGMMQDSMLKLSGAQEVPPVSTTASGSGRIVVAADGAVSGSVKTSGLDGTMAHIHIGSPGANGPVIIPLTKGGDGSWMVPPGAKLTADQMRSYQAGDLYVNVHTAANKGGEIRAQLKP